MQAPGAIPAANPQFGVPYGMLGEAPAGGPNTAAIANLPPMGAPVAFAAPAPAVGVPLDIAGLGLTPANTALVNDIPGGGDQWAAALQSAQLLTQMNQNQNYIAGKADEVRRQMWGRLRQIYFRILSIQNLVGAAGTAQTALVQLINEINAAGQFTPEHATALAQLANDLHAMDIPQILQALLTEVNSLAAHVGITPEAIAAGLGPPDLSIGDTAGGELHGGRRKKKTNKKPKKLRKKKGGYKFTHAAISRRSLRQSRRKSVSRQHKKHKKHKKRKQTKRRRKRRL